MSLIESPALDRNIPQPGLGFQPFVLEKCERRWERVQNYMERKGFDVAVVWGKTSGVCKRAGDILYLANFFSTRS